MSWLLLLVAPALAGEYRRLDLADGRTITVEVLGATPDGLEVAVRQGRMLLPFDRVTNITPISAADWQAVAPLRILFLPVVTDPGGPPADAQAADLQLRAERGALPRTTVLQIGELALSEDARAQLRGCGVDVVCIHQSTAPLPVDVTLVCNLGGPVDAPSLTLASAWRGYPDVQAAGTVPFAADAESRRISASSAVHDALGLRRVTTPLAPIVTAPATAASPWTVLGVEDPMVAAVPLPALAPPAVVPPPEPSDSPWGAPAAPAPTGVPVIPPVVVPDTPPADEPASPGSAPPAATPPTAPPPAATTPAPVSPTATLPGARLTNSPVSPALAFVPLPGFPEWVSGDTAHGLLATALVVPGTAAIVYVSGASTSRPVEFAALSGLGYYSLCVATSRAFLPVVTPTDGGASVGLLGIW